MSPLTLNGVLIPFTGPSSFDLNIIDPCLTNELEWASVFKGITYTIGTGSSAT